MSAPLLLIFILIILYCKAEESAEALFRRTIELWRSKKTWEPWDDYTNQLLNRWGKMNKKENRLEIIGGLEEGILAIEKATAALGEGQDAKRDHTLSKLYCAYGKALLELTASECHRLALDPYTLLIGIETVKSDDKPSVFLCAENAENALRNAATLDATNTAAEELLETIIGVDLVHERKPKEFVAELFDSFADSFDQKLVDDLGYTVPQLVGEAAKKLRPTYKAVLDAGCGTGLVGRYLRPLVERIMIGVDASTKMLDIARQCTTRQGCGLNTCEPEGGEGCEDIGEPLYDDLLALDLEEMTLENTLHTQRMKNSDTSLAGFDLIVAADVLVYFGSLSAVLKTFSKISTPGAGLIFSCERAEDSEAPLGWRLLKSGRFSHTKKHALEAASEAGYELVLYEEMVPRMEKGQEVQGHLFSFRLKASSEAKDEL